MTFPFTKNSELSQARTTRIPQVNGMSNKWNMHAGMMKVRDIKNGVRITWKALLVPKATKTIEGNSAEHLYAWNKDSKYYFFLCYKCKTSKINNQFYFQIFIHCTVSRQFGTRLNKTTNSASSQTSKFVILTNT